MYMLKLFSFWNWSVPLFCHTVYLTIKSELPFFLVSGAGGSSSRDFSVASRYLGGCRGF